MARRVNKRPEKRGVKYRSNFELEIGEALHRHKCEAEYEPEGVPYVIQHLYIPDWRLPNGILIEAKGRLTQFDRQKMLAVRKANSNLDIRFVFMNANNKLNKRSKTTYADWAEKNGFQWAERRVPRDWIEE